MKKMKFTPRIISVFTFCLFLMGAVSCNKGDDRPAPPNTNEEGEQGGEEEGKLPTIVELAQSVDELSNLVAAIRTVDPAIWEALGSSDPKTVFAPSNAAFEALFSQLEGFDGLADFDETEEKLLLAEILKYHVIAGEAKLAEMLSDGETLNTLQTEELSIKVDANVYVQDKSEEAAKVTVADNKAANGVVHIIDKILLPNAVIVKLFPKPTLVELVDGTDDLSLLKEALEKADLTDALSETGPFTLFAPTNAAINQLFEILGDGYDSFDDFDNFLEVQVLEKILLYHVVPDNLSTLALTPGTLPTLLPGNTLETANVGDTFVVKDASGTDANIVNADNEASNGYVHHIDKILIPQELIDLVGDTESVTDKTIKELVEESPELSFLKTALEITGLLEVLDAEGPYTVFAPSNEVLTSLFPLFGNSISSMGDFDTTQEIALLREVLLYHVLPEKLVESDFKVADLETLSGVNTLALINHSSGFSLLDATGFEATFLTNDITAKNGIVHMVDRILVPRSVIQEISEDAIRVLDYFLENSDHLTEVYRIFRMVGANLDSFLDAEFTFFFPTNSAFLDLFETLPGYDSLADFNTAEELGLLVEILEYHCIEASKLKSSEFTDKQFLTTAQGELLEVRLSNEAVYVLDKTGIPSRVIGADNEILQGVIHTVDKVLVSQELLAKLAS